MTLSREKLDALRSDVCNPDLTCDAIEELHSNLNAICDSDAQAGGEVYVLTQRVEELESRLAAIEERQGKDEGQRQAAVTSGPSGQAPGSAEAPASPAAPLPAVSREDEVAALTRERDEARKDATAAHEVRNACARAFGLAEAEVTSLRERLDAADRAEVNAALLLIGYEQSRSGSRSGSGSGSRSGSLS